MAEASWKLERLPACRSSAAAGGGRRSARCRPARRGPRGPGRWPRRARTPRSPTGEEGGDLGVAVGPGDEHVAQVADGVVLHVVHVAQAAQRLRRQWLRHGTSRSRCPRGRASPRGFGRWRYRRSCSLFVAGAGEDDLPSGRASHDLGRYRWRHQRRQDRRRDHDPRDDTRIGHEFRTPWLRRPGQPGTRHDGRRLGEPASGRNLREGGWRGRGARQAV